MKNRLVIVKSDNHIVMAFSMIALSNVASNCEIYEENMPDEIRYRRLAWKSLSDDEKLTVIINWEEAPIETGTYWLTGEESVIVTFNTYDDAYLGPIIVYVNPEKNEVLGQALRL